MAFHNMVERWQRISSFVRKHRADSWRVVRLVLSVLAFTVVSQLLLLYVSKVPSSAEKVSWSATPASATVCVVR